MNFHPQISFNYRSVWKLALFSWLMTFLASITIGVTVGCTLEKKLGHSFEMKNLLLGFDRTVITDLINEHQDFFSPLHLAIFICAALFYFMHVFINTNILYSLTHPDHALKNTIKKSVKYYLPFLGFSFFFGLVTIATAIIIYMIYAAILENPIEDYKSEMPFFYSLLGVIILFLIKATWIWMWSIHTRNHFLIGATFFKAITLGIKSLTAKISYHFLILIVVWFLTIFTFYCQYKLHMIVSGRSWILIVLVFMLMQGLVFFRCVWKIWVMEMIVIFKYDKNKN